MIHDTQSAQISQKQDGRNVMCPSHCFHDCIYIYTYICIYIRNNNRELLRQREKETKSTLAYTQPISLVLLFKCVQLMLPFTLIS